MSEMSNEELNEWLAVNVMGWAECNPKRTDYIGCWHQRGEPDFAGDIAAAFQVVERMRERGMTFEITTGIDGKCYVVIQYWEPQKIMPKWRVAQNAPTLAELPRLICSTTREALEKKGL